VDDETECEKKPPAKQVISASRSKWAQYAPESEVLLVHILYSIYIHKTLTDLQTVEIETKSSPHSPVITRNNDQEAGHSKKRQSKVSHSKWILYDSGPGGEVRDSAIVNINQPIQLAITE
jgi:hypothetical protein